MHILIIEDGPKLGSLLQRGLAEEGNTAVVSTDGVRGLAEAAKTSFDVIVLDVMLPRMDGFEVARQLRAAGKTVPILMLTARDSNTDVIAGLDAGADDYLTKPFSFDVLLARIRALV